MILSIGKFNPIHSGHLSMISLAASTVNKKVVLGTTRESEIAYIEKLEIPCIHDIFYARHGLNPNFLTNIINEYNITHIVCGSDRRKDFEKLRNTYFPSLSIISCLRTNVSSTQIKSALRNNEINQFFNMMGTQKMETLFYYKEKYVKSS